MKGRLALRRVAVLLGTLCTILAVWYLTVRPTSLIVAVGSPGSAQIAYLENLAKVMKDTRQPFRLKIVPVEGSKGASDLLDHGRVDLAVLRSDVLEAKDSRSIVILHKRAVVLVTRKDAKIETLRDIEGKPIGIVNSDRDSYKPLIERIMSHYDVDEEALKLEEMPRKAIVEAMAQKRIDGFVMISNPASRLSRGLMTELAGAGKMELEVKGAPAHAALALRFSDLHTSKIPDGAFGSQPSEDVDTVGVTLELTATSRMSDQTATALTKSLLEVRGRLRNPQTISYNIETPPVDEERRFLPHAGTAAFVNDEAKTLFEQYSDHIWLTLFSLGVIGSSIAGILSWAGLRREAPAASLADKMRQLAARLEAAGSVAEVDAVQGDFDDLVLAIMREYGLRNLSNEGGTDPSLWLNTFAGLIARRRALLVDMVPAAKPAAAPVELQRLAR